MLGVILEKSCHQWNVSCLCALSHRDRERERVIWQPATLVSNKQKTKFWPGLGPPSLFSPLAFQLGFFSFNSHFCWSIENNGNRREQSAEERWDQQEPRELVQDSVRTLLVGDAGGLRRPVGVHQWKRRRVSLRDRDAGEREHLHQDESARYPWGWCQIFSSGC